MNPCPALFPSALFSRDYVRRPRLAARTGLSGWPRDQTEAAREGRVRRQAATRAAAGAGGRKESKACLCACVRMCCVLGEGCAIKLQREASTVQSQALLHQRWSVAAAAAVACLPSFHCFCWGPLVSYECMQQPLSISERQRVRQARSPLLLLLPAN